MKEPKRKSRRRPPGSPPSPARRGPGSRRRDSQLAAIHAVAEAVSSSLKLREVLERALDKTLEVAGAEAGAIYLKDPSGERLVLAVHRGISGPSADAMQSFGLNESRIGEVARTGQPWRVDDMADVPFAPAALLREGIRSAVNLPVTARDVIHGLLSIGSRTPRRFRAEDMPFYASVARQIGVAVENARLYETSRRELAERARVEEALHASGQLYQTTLDALDEWVHMVDRDLRILFMNRSFADRCRTLGLATDIVGKRVPELFPFLPAQVQDEYRRVFESGQPCVTVETNRIDGQTFRAEIRKIPVVKDGRVERVITVVRDVTEEKRAEEALRESGHLYHTTIDALDEWLHVVDRDLRFVYWNKAFRDLCVRLGLASDAMGKRIQDLVPFLPARVYEEYRQVLESGQPCSTLETTVVEGRTYHTETRKIPILEHGRVERVITVIRDVSDRVRAEEALRKSEERFSKAFHMNHVAMAIARQADGRFLDVNLSWERLFGYTRGELVGRTSLEVGLFSDPDARQAFLRRGCDEGVIPEVEVRMRTKSGEIRELLGSAQALDIGGEACFISTFQDITGRKRAEEALRDSELKYRTLFEAESDALFLIDNETGRLLEVNSAAVALYGYGRDELLRMKNTDLSAQPDETRRATQGGTTLIPLRFHRKKDGTVFPVEITARHVTWQGRPVHLAAIRDITARHRAESALQESEARFRALFEYAPDAYFLVDMAGTFLDGNRAAERLSGYERGELIGKSLFESGLLLPDGSARATEVLSRSVPGTSGSPDEFTVVRKDGRRVPLEVLTFPIEIGGRPVLLGIARDVTERKRAEAATRDLSHRLLQAQEEERRRIARDLHDSTAQKLAALIMALGRLDESTAGAGDAARKLVAECLATAEDCVQEIRSLSHLLHPPLLDELGLEAALDAYVQGFSKRSGIAVTLDMPPDPGRLPGDVELALFRIVQEGLGNVLKHAGCAEATVQLARLRDRVLLEVRDRGRGIPADLLERLRNRQPSPGMGIAGMRERLDPLGGQLEIDSSTEGTTVRAVVPVPPGPP